MSGSARDSSATTEVRAGSDQSALNAEGVAAYMGTFAEAKAEFLSRYDAYCSYQGAVIGDAKQLRKYEAAKREAELRFMLAGANLAWHMLNNPAALPKATGGV